MTHRKQLGAWGESVAAHYLEAHGYRILARNWRCQFGEIDLIAQNEAWLLFVEVKTRQGRQYGTPEQAITPRKSEKLLAAAQAYLLAEALDTPWRIDLMAIELDAQGKLRRCEQIPNAVMVSW